MSTAGVITGTIDANASVTSPYTVTVTASDGTGSDDVTDVFVWTVTDDAPVLGTPIANQADTDADSVSLNVGGNFSDDDTLTISASGLPGGLSMSTAGVITGTIDANASVTSPYTVTVTASDGTGSDDVTDVFVWTVTDDAPVLGTPIANQADTDADSVSLNVGGNFSDDDTLTISASGLPGGLSMSTAGVITGTIDANASVTSPYTVTVTASDGTGSDDVTDVFVWTVTDDAPVLGTPIANQADTDADSVSLNVGGNFSDDDTLTISASGLPGGLSMSTAGVITGTIDANASVTSPYTVTVTASDGTGSDDVTDVFVWTVTDDAPVLGTPIANQADTDADSVSLNVGGNFSDDDTLTISASGLPGGLSMSTAGVITGTIDANASVTSPYTVTVTASDGTGSDDVTDVFVWTVTDDAPVLGTPIANQADTDADSVSLNVGGNFSDDDTLTISASGLPGGLSMSTAGVITGTIDANASVTSPYTVTVTASDGTGSDDVTDVFVWTVTDDAPVLGTPIANQADTDADSVSLNVGGNFSDDDTLTISASGLPGGLSMSTAGVITGTIDANASVTSPYTVTVTASDGTGSDDVTDVFVWTVTDVAPSARHTHCGSDGHVTLIP